MNTQIYTKEEALKSSTEYFNNDILAADVTVGKYLLTDKQGNFLELNPDDMHRRLAKEFSRIEKKYPNPMTEEEVYQLFKRFGKVVAQGSPMAAVGNPYQTMSASNCFVAASPEDSYSGIFFTDFELGSIFKRRGGCGTDISKIRPKGLKVNNAAKTTDGIGPFMERFSSTCREVAINGRRGALMLTISIHHPEIRTFLNIKKDRTKVTGANISIRITDEFMNAVMAKEKFQLRWPVDSENPSIIDYVDAEELWNEIIHSAWESAEPGVLFWSTSQRNTPSDVYNLLKMISTNPCSEILLAAYDACRLMVLNLIAFIKNMFKENAEIDWQELKDTAYKAQKLMDDLVDLDIELTTKIIEKIESDPESAQVKVIELNLWKKIRDICIAGRRTGLGPTAVGDMIAMMNMFYGSEESISLVEEVYKTITMGAYRATVDMARDRGPFPLYDYELEKDHPYLNQIFNEDAELKADYIKYGRRNCALTTTAPTGSVSILTQTTSGIEPVFMLSYQRKRKINPNDVTSKVDFVDQSGDKWQNYVVDHPGFAKWKEVTGLTDVKDSPYFNSTANEIDWESSVRIQAAAQKWVDHAISKTCNLPKTATVEDVKKVYELAWKSGCKGFTVYRDGSRTGVLTAVEEKKEDKTPITLTNFKRPNVLPCHIYHSKVKGESWVVIVGLKNGQPYEVFCGLKKYIEIPKKYKDGNVSKSKGKGEDEGRNIYTLRVGEGDDQIVVHDIVKTFDNQNNSSLSRIVSLSLRHETPVNFITEQLLKDKDSDMYSFSRVVARVLKNYIPDGTKPSNSADSQCPSCKGSKVAYQEKCLICMDCGYSKCS